MQGGGEGSCKEGGGGREGCEPCLLPSCRPHQCGTRVRDGAADGD